MATSADLAKCERWFVRRGLPHMIDRYSATDDIFTRMAPFLALVLFAELFLAFGDRWTGWAQLVAFVVGVAGLVAATAMVNRSRGRPAFELPEDIGGWELAVFVFLPILPAALGAQTSVGENVLTVVVVNLVVIAVGYVVTSWGLVPMLRWSIGQTGRHLGHVLNLALKVLPTLLLFSAFIFINAEMWQVANDFTLPLFGAVLALVGSVGVVFVVVSVRRLSFELTRFSGWREVRGRCVGTPMEGHVPDDGAPLKVYPLSRGQRRNVMLLLFVSQAVPIVLVSLLVTGFYVVFGLLTVRAETLMQWTTATELTAAADWAVSWPLLGAEVVFTRQLLLVSAFIGLFSGLNFAVQIVTDEAYRKDFADGMTKEVHDALAVRVAYRHQVAASDLPIGD